MPQTIPDRNVKQLLLDIDLGAADQARLCDLHEKLGLALSEIAERLVDRLALRPDAAVRVTSPEHRAQLCDVLIAWLASGLVGPHADHFGARGLRLAAGLSQRNAIAAVSLVRAEYHDRIAQHYEPGQARLVTQSIDKLLDVELAMLVREPIEPDTQHRARDRRTQSDRIAAIQTLSAGLAHEVRNPLNSARLQLQLLERRLRRAAADPKLIQPVEQVDHEMERLTRLLNEFLSFARPSQLALAEHDVAGLVRDVVAAQAARGAAIEVTGADSLDAHVDADKLRQIAHNLVRNALEAAAPGGHVVVTVDGDEADLRLIVEDDGPGIPEAVQRRIYEPFFTTKDSGTGLGLSIVHGMVAAHGGTIIVDSVPGRTRFAVSLPRWPPQTPIASA